MYVYIIFSHFYFSFSFSYFSTLRNVAFAIIYVLTEIKSNIFIF